MEGRREVLIDDDEYEDDEYDDEEDEVKDDEDEDGVGKVFG